MNKNEIKEVLDDRSIFYPANATKSELEEILAANPEPAPEDGSDEALPEVESTPEPVTESVEAPSPEDVNDVTTAAPAEEVKPGYSAEERRALIAAKRAAGLTLDQAEKVVADQETWDIQQGAI